MGKARQKSFIGKSLVLTFAAPRKAVTAITAALIVAALIVS
jgi:hypothetical protein